MKNFFDIEEVQESAYKKPKPKKHTREMYYSCEQCGLYKQCSSPKIKVHGKGKKNILFVIDSPTIKSDRLGVPASGETKQCLLSLCEEAGLDYNKDIYVINAIQCRHNKTNSATIPACRQRLQKIISLLEPTGVVAFGTEALQVIIGDKISIGKIERWDGWEIPYHGYSTVLYPTYSIQDYIKEKYNPVIEKKMVSQIKKAGTQKYVDYRIPVKENVHVLTKTQEITNMLLTMETKDVVAFDYETTGLQPYKKGHEIICMSISDDTDSYAFLLQPAVIPYVKHFLESDVPKVIHNAKFEIQWGTVCLGVQTNNIVADTMLTAHCLNNNEGIVSLKYQGFVNFGIAGYEDNIKHLWESDEEANIHSFNKLYILKKSGNLYQVQDELLEYCAVDSLLTIKLYRKQQQAIYKAPLLSTGGSIQDGISLFLEGTKAFADIEMRGIQVDMYTVEQNISVLEKKIEQTYNSIYETDEVKQWNRSYAFKFTSDTDLPVLLYDILKYPVLKETKGGGKSTDAKTLEKLLETTNSEFLSLVMSYRKYTKILNTYLKGIQKGSYDNIIHPALTLHTARTFRSASSDPINLQNIPKRDKVAKQMIRSTFVARPHFFIEEIDFSSLEVNIGNCHHKDPNMKRYLDDPASDMHRDVGCQLFIRTKEELLPEERQNTKGSFVFAQQYGDWYVACAKNLWSNMKDVSKKHLATHGYTTLEKYTELVKEVEHDFWHNRFKVFNDWKEKNYKKYTTHGHIDFYTGFRSTAFCTRNQAGNIAIQGSAFHCLLWTLIYIHKEIKNRGLQSCIISEIHDSILLEIHEKEVDIIHSIVYNALYNLKESWRWIDVPLTMKYDQAPLQGPWLEVKEAGEIRSDM
jgi:uracil-DNA glycosylase family 4